MGNTERVLRARIQAVDNFTQPMRRIISQTKAFQAVAKAVKPIVLKVKDMASKVINKVKAQIDKFKNTKFGQFILKAKDMASKVIKKVTSLTKSFVSKVWKTTVAIKDKASSILGGIKSKLAMLASGVTIGVAVKQIAGGAMDLQQNETTIRHFMGVGNSGKNDAQLNKMSKNYSNWLVNNSNATPFTTAEVMAGGAKALVATGGNVEKAQTLIKRAEDMAGLMGKPLEQAVDALMDVEMGQYARLVEFGVSADGGADGQSPEEVLAEIDRRFAGGAEKLSQSAKGKMSTVMGKISSSLASIGTAFLPIMSNMFDNISGLVDSVTPKITAFAGKTAEAFNSFAQSEQANQYMQIFQGIGTTVFNAVGAVIQAVSPIVQSIFNFIGQHSQQISVIIQMFGTIWGSVWKTIGTLLQGAWAICQPILSTLIGAIAKAQGAVDALCSAWNKMTELLKTPINAVVNVAQKATSWVGEKLGLSEGNNAFGSGRIARDGTIRTLHEGEKVLTKQEANRYEKGSNTNGINIVVNGLTVREESDINKIASQLLKKINENKIVYAGGAY